MFSENRHYISGHGDIHPFVTKRFGRVKDSLKRLLPIFVTLFSLNFTAHAQTLIRKGSNNYSTPIYNWDGLNLRNGNSYGKVIINWDGKNIRNGSSPYGTILYNWDGENIRMGSSPYGTILYNWDGENIRSGYSKYNTVLYKWDGKYLKKGPGYGPILYITEGSVPIVILLYILLRNEY